MNPFELANSIEERYKTYLETTFYFKDAVLRESFRHTLQNGRIRKGPYVEANPIYKRGRNLREVAEQMLGCKPDEAFLEALQADERRLYLHQENSIINVLHHQRNIFVATGTASGKTECFILPVLLHLYEEFLKGSLCKPGVRALILYPMNALANDQRDRLGEIARRLHDHGSSFSFTFGEYTGETPEDMSDTKRNAAEREKRRQPGELVFRSEMRSSPPHILLTNYSMLEYLLIRPEDSPLFDSMRSANWRFLVVDEAHQYRGIRGVEMGMLMRRFKQRLREGGNHHKLICIATSATILGSDNDKDDVASFASTLFGECFDSDDIILGEEETITETGDICLQPDDYVLLNKAVTTQDYDLLRQVALRVGVNIPADFESALSVILCSDRRAVDLRKRLAKGPQLLEKVACEVNQDVPVEERRKVVVHLISLLVQAKHSQLHVPLLTVRYHLLLRSLEGAFLSFLPNPCSPRVLLERNADEGTLFEVALCKECGQHYLVGQIRDSHLVEAIRDPSLQETNVSFFLPVVPRDNIQGEELEPAVEQDHKKWQLCVQCGSISSSPLACRHTGKTITVIKADVSENDETEVRQCLVCGYKGNDPVREVVHGADGPHVVIATTLFQHLPQDRRKILAFADSRQEAAFFAWYFEDSYRDILARNRLYHALAELQRGDTDSDISLHTLAGRLLNLYDKEKVFPESSDIYSKRKKVWTTLYREFLTEETRISLEGTGLVRWYVKWPESFQIPDLLCDSPWDLDREEAEDLCLFLLGTLRLDKAVELQIGEDVNWDDLELQRSQTIVRLGAPRSQKNYVSWDSGRRARFMSKLLQLSGMGRTEADDRASKALREIWDAFDIVMKRVEDGKRLDLSWWRAELLTSESVVHLCTTCNRIHPVSIKGLCLRRDCRGSLQPVSAKCLERNHYRSLYVDATLPSNLRVEEHSAQLQSEAAYERQKAFRKGDIHVLSCSTTFELGVDLGDLDVIFLRNVPPESFNYTQRVGRAGRRSGSPGFALTYCRRSPHDLYYFAYPHGMLEGKIRPPVTSLTNEKIISRHVTATVLSFFFRAYPERFGNVERLLGNMSNPSGVTDIRSYLQGHRDTVEESLWGIVPREMQKSMGLHDGTWIERLFGEQSRFAEAEAEVFEDFRQVKNMEERCRQERRYDDAKWAQKRAETISQEDTLSFLSRKAVIPKYGFPVDLVELDTNFVLQTEETSKIVLQRDLSIAISEFAPTCKVVANKKEWTSYALKKVAEREWERWLYCITHHRFIKKEHSDERKCCRVMRELVVPRYGFSVCRTEKVTAPRKRSVRIFTSRPFLVELLETRPNEIDFGTLVVTKASPGRLIVICEGERGGGFYICSSCGAGFRERKRSHDTPYGFPCGGTLQRLSLGHEMVTDVVGLRFELQHAKHDNWFAYSLAYALLESAAEVLEVPSNELSVTVDKAKENLPVVVLYDNVPGGAGLVARLEQKRILLDILGTARRRVEGRCGCAEESSCYGCLRSYRNQFAHVHLKRGPVHRYLNDLLNSLGEG